MRTVIALLGLATGCSGFGTYTAKTLPAGKTGATLTVLAAADPESNDRVINPVPQVGVRHGTSDNTEVGVRFLGPYNEVDFKMRLFSSDHVHVAVAPIFGYGFELEGSGNASASLATLATFDTGDSVSFLAGVRAGSNYVIDSGETGDIRAAFIGLELQGRTVQVRPCIEAVQTPDFETVSVALQFGGTP